MSGKLKDSVVSKVQAQPERRRHIRYNVQQDALFYNQEHFAEIINISRSGIACRCMVESEIFSPVLTNIDLLDCNGGMFVQGLSCRRIRRHSPKQIPVHLHHYHTRDCYFEFVDLQDVHEEDIEKFILACAELPDVRENCQ
ncbi:PilZ domain-containing protein [Desulfopila sp. IMCC35008]|uniref:PilZ domain-containing protein n=1 Tax=Desulfopila sp. IMCC35008 TaxID=2653858 RepID=UPI0013D0528C|nr:PilZ domain-containing protein [Desulfopila sp. IMCC35008]